MKVFTVLILLFATLGAVMLTGCELANVIEEALQEAETETKISAESQELALESVIKLHQRRYETIENAIEEGTRGVSTLDGDLDRILMEETGLDTSEVDFLSRIHFEHNPEDAMRFKVATSDLNLIAEYIGFRFEHPGKQTEEILALFRQSVQAGNTTVSPERIAELYNFYILDTPRERARKITLEYYYKTQELYEEHQARFEVTGIDDYLLKNLFDIYVEEKSLTTGLSDIHIIYSYLRLVFEYPGQSKEALLVLFRELVKNGKVFGYIDEVRVRFLMNPEYE